MKIGKAIKTVRKLAKSALGEAPALSPHRRTLRFAKALAEKFDDELCARSEATSLRRAADAILGSKRMRCAASELECVADLAMTHLAANQRLAKKDAISAVAIVRALAWAIRASEPGGVGGEGRRDQVQADLRFA